MSYNLCYGVNTQVKSSNVSYATNTQPINSSNASYATNTQPTISSNVSYNNSSVASYNMSYATNTQQIKSSNVSYATNNQAVNSNNTNYSGCYSLAEALKRANTITSNTNQSIGIKSLKSMLLERIKNRLSRRSKKI